MYTDFQSFETIMSNLVYMRIFHLFYFLCKGQYLFSFASFISRMLSGELPLYKLFIHSHGNVICIWKKQSSRVTSRDVKQENE